jgi:NADH dehydrogenase
VVIVGAGFGGLTAARALRRAPVDVLLVDRDNYHLFTPLLYQVASALLSPGEIARPVRSLLRGFRNATFRLANVESIDVAGRRVVTDRGEVDYHYLVVAAGSATNFFGNRSLAEQALPLKELGEGLALRNWVLSQFEASRWETDPVRRRRLLTIAVVGGGPTGVELAGAFSELIRIVLRRDLPDLDLNEVRVVLLEGSDTLLAAFDSGLRQAADAALRRKRVEIWYQALVRSVDGGLVELADGRRLEATTVVWTAGVRAAEVAGMLTESPGSQGRVRVRPTLQLPAHPEVFVIGDAAAVEVRGELLPMLIPVAMQEAKHCARSIHRLLMEREPEAFQYRDPGIMATIGRNAAVAQLGPVRLAGFLGWLMWLGVHLVNVISFRSRLVVLVNWAWDYLFYDRPVRLIVEARAPGAGRSTPPPASRRRRAG